MLRPPSWMLALPVLSGCRADADLELGWVLPAGRVGFEYDETVADGDEEGEWSLTGGAIPLGLELTTDGRLSGTPESSGLYEFEIGFSGPRGLEAAGSYELTIPPVALLSGYEPFGGNDTNPSIEALWTFQEELLAGLDLRVVELPVVWGDAWDVLHEEIVALDPSVVISTGQAGTDAMRFESRAQNLQWGTDNNDVSKYNLPIVEDGPDELYDTLPQAEMTTAMEEAGYATLLSDDAGTYLCNYVFYELMYYATYESERDLVAGFIHVSPATDGYEYDVEDITEAHRLGLEALSDWIASGEVQAARLPATLHSAPVYHR